MVVTMNARSLMNFFGLRCCSRAQWEIRDVARQMVALVYPVAPHLFAKAGPPCVAGKCPEGKMSCGKMLEMREEYDKLKEMSLNG
jgi:thymidylate synthase (FAD)